MHTARGIGIMYAAMKRLGAITTMHFVMIMKNHLQPEHAMLG